MGSSDFAHTDPGRVKLRNDCMDAAGAVRSSKAFRGNPGALVPQLRTGPRTSAMRIRYREDIDNDPCGY